MISIELEITLRCNRKCQQCNRLCNVPQYTDHADSDMTLTQIHQFCSDVIASEERVHHVSVVGGEPLMHPKFQMFTEALYARLRSCSLIKKLYLTTNGDKIQEVHPSILGRYDTITVDYHKSSFVAFMSAPKDTGQTQKRCMVPTHCGIACNAYGYWPCGPGGAIARLFNMPQYRRLFLPSSLSEFEEPNELGNYKSLCDLCQWSAKKRKTVLQNPMPTKSFTEALKAYALSPPEWPKL